MNQLHTFTDYKHDNQVLMFIDPNKFVLMSYGTIVLEIVNNEILIDARSKHLKNYNGRKSTTTSKHIGQALNYLKEKGLIEN